MLGGGADNQPESSDGCEYAAVLRLPECTHTITSRLLGCRAHARLALPDHTHPASQPRPMGGVEGLASTMRCPRIPLATRYQTQ
eukprot:COSAG02_NODE_12704_length_1506_cov_202.103767_1_plen_83_part_10